MASASSTPSSSSAHLTAAADAAADCRLAVMQLHRLQSLPTQLLEHILRFLPMRDKTLRLSRLSHSFPTLTPACFSEDALTLSKPAVRALARSPSLRSLLSRVRDVSVLAVRWPEKQRAETPALERSARLLVDVSAFSRPQSLTIRLDWSSWWEKPMRTLDVRDILTSLSSLPLLQSLSIELTSSSVHGRIRPQDLALLSGLRSLRSLRSNSQLAVGSLSVLCSLPLQHLDLSDASLELDDEQDAQLATSAPPAPDVSCSLRRLHLPHAVAEDANAEVRRVLMAYGMDRCAGADAEQRRDAVQLEIVDNFYEKLDALLLWIPSLTALTLRVMLGTRLFAQPGLMLPQLRSVLLHTRETDGSEVGGLRAGGGGAITRRAARRLSNVAAECDAFLRAYSRQLQGLDVHWLPGQLATAPILQAAVHCQQLRHLGLHGTGRGAADCFAAVSFIQLPHLHTLRLVSLELSAAQLASLLQACPAVEHITLRSLSAFTLELLPVIGRSCRLLKQLEAECCERGLFSQPVEERLTAAERTTSDGQAFFPQLVALTIGDLNERFFPVSPRALQWLLRLLHSAPVLRFLRLDLDLNDSELRHFSSLNTLRGLRLRVIWTGRQQRFFCYGPRHRHPPPDLTVWQPVHEADREFDLALHYRSQGGLFRGKTERFQGKTGREAFFAAVEARLAGGQDEAERVRQEVRSGDMGDSDDEPAKVRYEDDWDSDDDEEAGIEEELSAAGEEEKDGEEGEVEEEKEEAQGQKRRRVHGS